MQCKWFDQPSIAGFEDKKKKKKGHEPKNADNF